MPSDFVELLARLSAAAEENIQSALDRNDPRFRLGLDLHRAVQLMSDQENLIGDVPINELGSRKGPRTRGERYSMYAGLSAGILVGQISEFVAVGVYICVLWSSGQLIPVGGLTLLLATLSFFGVGRWHYLKTRNEGKA